MECAWNGDLQNGALGVNEVALVGGHRDCRRRRPDVCPLPSAMPLIFAAHRKSRGAMVFFSCDGCGDMLKKSQVDAHVYKCKVGCDAVSCVDCSVSFYGGEF